MRSYLDIAEYIVRQCESLGINLCGNFEDWTKVAFALADLGEQGRQLFHRLASIDERYRERENENKFTNALRTASRIKFPTLLYMAKQNGISLADIHPSEDWSKPTRKAPQHPKIVAVDYLPIELIKTLDTGNNTFVVDFLCYYLDLGDVLDACNAYLLRSTPQKETVFPQIDTHGRLRTAKIIAYGTDGHRKKHADWLHARLMKVQGKEPSDFHLQQCLFGEHLLQERPSAKVGLVEAEKTAIICSMVFPEMVWLATGGQMNLNGDRCKCLTFRDVIVYPDANATEDWRQRCKSLTYCNTLTISDWAKDEPQGSKRDIADIIIEQRKKEVEHGA